MSITAWLRLPPRLRGLFIRALALVCFAGRGPYFARRAPFSKFPQGACPLYRSRGGAAPPSYRSQAERFSERLLRPLRNPHGTRTGGSRVCSLDNVPTIVDAANISDSSSLTCRGMLAGQKRLFLQVEQAAPPFGEA